MAYQSSNLSFLYKYFFPPVIIISVLYGMSHFYNMEDESMTNLASAIGIMFLWIFIFIIQIPFSLKTIKVDSLGMTILGQNSEQMIPFKNINSIGYFELSSPWMLTVKYLDPIQLQLKKLIYLPTRHNDDYNKKDTMTQFFIEQSRIHNSKFKETNTLKNLLKLALLATPFIIGALYFILKIDFSNFPPQ